MALTGYTSIVSTFLLLLGVAGVNCTHDACCQHFNCVVEREAGVCSDPARVGINSTAVESMNRDFEPIYNANLGLYSDVFGPGENQTQALDLSFTVGCPIHCWYQQPYCYIAAVWSNGQWYLVVHHPVWFQRIRICWCPWYQRCYKIRIFRGSKRGRCVPLYSYSKILVYIYNYFTGRGYFAWRWIKTVSDCCCHVQN